MDKVVTMWCEWEIGCEQSVFADMATAKAVAAKCLEGCCIEESVEELIGAGLIGFETKTIVKSA